MENQGSFKLLKSLLGSIAGSLSSIASLPFGKRKTPEAPLLMQPPPAPPPPSAPFTRFDHDGETISKLYPDMELSETRKRARLALDGVSEEKGECSNEKQKQCNGVSREGAGETSDVCDVCVTPIPRNQSSYVDATLDKCDVTVLGSGVPQGGNTKLHTHNHSDDDTHGMSHVGKPILHSSYGFDVELQGGNGTSDEKMVIEHEEMLHELGNNFDDNLASFRRTLVAKKMKQKKRGQELVKAEEIPRKRVRFGNAELGLSSDAQSNLTSSVNDAGMLLKKCTSGTKRKRADEAEDRNDKKLMALTLSEEVVHTEGKVSTDGIAGVSTRKRERADREKAHMKSVDEELELGKVVLVQNLPLNASRKAISKVFSQFGAMESMELRSLFFYYERNRRKPTSSGEINKTPNSQIAEIVYKNELCATAALSHNMKEFNGNILRVTAARLHGTSKEADSAALDETWSLFVRNIPIDVKDEELFQLFGAGGSLKLDVKAVRVPRDPKTGFSRGTAHVFFKTQADMDCLLSSRQTLKWKGRVLRLSRASGSMQVEHMLSQPRLAKRSTNAQAHESDSHEKRVKLSSPHEAVEISKKPEHQERQIYTRSKQSNLGSPKELSGVYTSSSHVYTTRHAAAIKDQSKNSEDSPEAKRKRLENRQRGISRSKKIRRT